MHHKTYINMYLLYGIISTRFPFFSTGDSPSLEGKYSEHSDAQSLGPVRCRWAAGFVTMSVTRWGRGWGRGEESTSDVMWSAVRGVEISRGLSRCLPHGGGGGGDVAGIVRVTLCEMRYGVEISRGL